MLRDTLFYRQKLFETQPNQRKKIFEFLRGYEKVLLNNGDL